MTCKREHSRYNCRGSADLSNGTNCRVWGELGDISLAGFYVSTYGPLPISTEVRFKIEVEGEVICGAGEVATSHPGVGMAVIFHDLSSQYRQTLQWVIRELSQCNGSPAGIGLRI
ncbi:MAG TPA: PilZ domain-containing protein [Candidatus Koribacter sp.]|jgi:hypothetical protein